MSDALLGVLLGGAISSLSAWLVGLRSERSAAARQKEQLQHERIERRYTDRKTAYTTFLSVTQSRARGIDRFTEKEGVSPAKVFDVGPMPEAIETALAELALVAPDDTAAAASEHASALWDLEFRDKPRANVVSTRDAFEVLARRDLRGAS